MSVTLNGTSGLVFSDGTIQGTAGAMAFRNRIINGDMRIAQRGTGALTVSTADNFPVDRFKCNGSTSGKCTVQQNAGSVTPPAGFTNYLGVTSSSAYSVPSGEAYSINHLIEGNNVSDFAWGTANAKAATLSFWARSSLTGTFGGVVINGPADRNYPFTYSISSANTWEYKTITIPGDTTGTWPTDNSGSIVIIWSLGCGSSFTGTPGVWSGGGSLFGATGQTQLIGTNGATLYITGAQFEKAEAATSFEHRPFGTELAMCERYYQIGTTYFNGQVTSGSVYYTLVNLRTYMRAAPTVSYTNIGNAAFPSSGNSYLLEPTRVGESRTGSTNSSSGIFTSNFAASSEL